MGQTSITRFGGCRGEVKLDGPTRPQRRGWVGYVLIDDDSPKPESRIRASVTLDAAIHRAENAQRMFGGGRHGACDGWPTRQVGELDRIHFHIWASIWQQEVHFRCFQKLHPPSFGQLTVEPPVANLGRIAAAAVGIAGT